MSGGKETPRQKMIGMMYLVLTALLALNVSSTVLEKFAILNSTLVELIDENEVTNEKLLQAILKSPSDDPKVVDAKAKAQQIRDLTKETMKKLNDLKVELGKEHNGKPMEGDELVGNTNIAEEKMLNEKSTLATDYEKTLVNYTTKLTELSGKTFHKLNKKAVDFPELKNAKGEVEHAEKSFIEFSFEGNPTMPAITGVTQMQTEILDYEGLALDSMNAIARGVLYDFDKVVPMVIGPSVVAAGAKYEGQLFMAGAASGVSPQMFRNGAPLTVTTDPETSIKMAKVEFAATATSYDANGLAKSSYTTEIRVAGKEPLKRTITYNVIRPTIRITNGNAPSLYMNCGNFVNVEVPALGASYNPGFSVKGGTFEKGDKIGRITIIPKEKKLFLTVSNSGSVIGTEPFDVKPIPKPRYVPRENSGKEIDIKVGIKAAGLRGFRVSADAEENFKAEVPKDANYRIRSMEVVLARGTSIVSQFVSQTESLDLGQWASQMKPGDRFVITVKTCVRNTYLNEQEPVSIVSGTLIIPIQ